MAGTGSRRLPQAVFYSRRNWVLNKKPVLLLHCDGADEGTTFKDSGGTGHTVTAEGDAQIDTAQSWRGASGLFDGVGDYLTVPDHADFDISTNWTVDFRVKHSNLDVTQEYISHYEDATHFWRFAHVPGEGLQFIMVEGEDTTIDTGNGGEIEDANWHHIALCKVGEEYGIYKDGVQFCHTSDASTQSIAGSLYIGATGVPGDYLRGHLDEIRIVKANVFRAAPVEGLTDKITVPGTPYISWR